VANLKNLGLLVFNGVVVDVEFDKMGEQGVEMCVKAQ
jgi:hypothetical protein